jgi:aryl-alcohol dehydrogenase-like predicted oxidoreductase
MNLSLADFFLLLRYPTEANVPRTLANLEKVAAEQKSTPANVALAWCMAKGVIPVIGVRDVEQLREIMHAGALELTNGQLESLDSASAIPLGYPHSVLLTYSGHAEVRLEEARG